MASDKKNSHAVILGRKGGLARKAKLSPAERSKAARAAVTARWDAVRAARKAAALKLAKQKSRKAGGATHV